MILPAWLPTTGPENKAVANSIQGKYVNNFITYNFSQDQIRKQKIILMIMGMIINDLIL